MKGNLIISGTAGKYKPSLIKPQAQLKQAKVIATNYACQLIKSKCNVVVPDNDIQACHFLYLTIPSWLGSGTARKGPPGIISRVKTEIKKGGKKEVGLYANFQLTNKRKSLMPSIRSMKKEGKISKLFANENGQ